MEIILALVILIFSAILHEIAHGYVADRLGDPTARLLGRLTLDPRKHIDPFLSILVPLMFYLSSGGTMLFGGAKPVPVDEFNLRDGRKDLALVALAGPLTNLLLAIFASALLRLLLAVLSATFSPAIVSILYPILLTFIRINLLLAIFNLIPIPPLDGSKVFSLLLPEEQAAKYLSLGRFGMLIIVFLFFFPFGPFSLSHLVGGLISFAETLLIP